MLVLDSQDRVLLKWRYRPATEEWGWEIPGGIVKISEGGTLTSARNLERETG